MRALKYICLVLAVTAFTQCKDYLEVSNPGEANDQFTTSTPSEAWKLVSGVYRLYEGTAAGENYNFQDPVGSDAEMMGEIGGVNAQAATMHNIPITLFNGSFNTFYSVTARASRVAAMIAANSQFQSDRDAGRVTEWTQMYGELWTLWARSYYMLATHWGDVPYGYENTAVDSYTLTSRFDIYDAIIEKLKEVEGMMFEVGEGGITAERANRTYANALIGETALLAAGYQTLRTDVEGLYGDVTFTDAAGYVADNESRYARRTDWRNYMDVAEEYLDRALNTYPGTSRLITTDSRPANNPFQVHWQEVNSRRVSPESIWEVAELSGQGKGEHPYSQGRPASNNNAFSKIQVFGSIRIIPTFLYTGYEDSDQRRDVSMAFTGVETQTGAETIIPWYHPDRKGSRLLGGGPAINKWDFNRGDNPNFPGFGNRSSGINYTILKVSDLMLMLAEAKAWLGSDDAGALRLVNEVRTRAKASTLTGLTGEALIDAVYNERKLELLGEGDIRWDMIRSGKFNQRALKVRQDMQDLIASLRANNNSHTFPNGKTLPSHIFTKLVYLDGQGFTGVTQEGVPNDPVRFPGWRGVYEWRPAGANWQDTPRNLAIKGLYEQLSDTEGLADGYKKVDWGKGIIDLLEVPNCPWDANIFLGIVGRENKAPRYLFPLPLNIISLSKGQIKNGYGLPSE